jgi:hypothetical protein
MIDKPKLACPPMHKEELRIPKIIWVSLLLDMSGME